MNRSALTLAATMGLFLGASLGLSGRGGAAPDVETRLLRLETDLASATQALGLLTTQVQGQGRLLDQVRSRLSELEDYVSELRRSFASLGPTAAPPTGPGTAQVEITDGRVEDKRLETRDDDTYLVVTVTGRIRSLPGGASRLKLMVHLADQADQPRKSFEILTDVVRAGESVRVRDQALKLVTIGDEDVWARTTDARDMRVRFDVLAVIPLPVRPR
jgi:hypothetical protein